MTEGETGEGGGARPEQGLGALGGSLDLILGITEPLRKGLVYFHLFCVDEHSVLLKGSFVMDFMHFLCNLGNE